MKFEKNHLFLLISVATIYAITIPLFSENYRFLSGCLWLGFWGYSFWLEIKLGKSFLKTKKQKLEVILVSTIGSIFFLPNDIQEYLSIFSQGLTVLLILLFFIRDDDKGDRNKKDNKKVDRKKLRWIPEIG